MMPRQFFPVPADWESPHETHSPNRLGGSPASDSGHVHRPVASGLALGPPVRQGQWPVAEALRVEKRISGTAAASAFNLTGRARGFDLGHHGQPALRSRPLRLAHYFQLDSRPELSTRLDCSSSSSSVGVVHGLPVGRLFRRNPAGGDCCRLNGGDGPCDPPPRVRPPAGATDAGGSPHYLSGIAQRKRDEACTCV